MTRRRWKPRVKTSKKIPLSQPIGMIGICGLVISIVFGLPLYFLAISAFFLILAYILVGYERWTYYHDSYVLMIWALIPCLVFLVLYFQEHPGKLFTVDYTTIAIVGLIASTVFSIWIVRYSYKQVIRTSTIIVGCVGVTWLATSLLFASGFNPGEFQGITLPEIGVEPIKTESPVYTGKYKVGQIATEVSVIEGYAIVGNDFYGHYRVKKVYIDNSGKGWHTQGPQEVQLLSYNKVESIYSVAWGGGIMDITHIPDRDWSIEQGGSISIQGISTTPTNSWITSTPTTSSIRITSTRTLVSSPSYTTIEKARQMLSIINGIRQENGVAALSFDERVYRLALARTNDMVQYQYMDHVNPVTGSCAYSMKSQFGFGGNEYVAENAYGDSRAYYEGIERNAISSWMNSRGHRFNLLYPHTAGSVVCSDGYCVFLGLNQNHFSEGCHTGAEGMAFWNSVGTQPYEK